MKLRNKKTGEIKAFDEVMREAYKWNNYNSLAELNTEWEDYEEPKKHYEILAMGAVMEREDAEDEIFRNQGQKEIGNYFETKEEAEKAVEKLKAWKRLKDKKFEFNEWYKPDGCDPFIVVETNIDYDVDNKELQKDLDLLFGGEE